MTTKKIPHETRAAITASVTAMLSPYGVLHERIGRGLERLFASVDGEDADGLGSRQPIPRAVSVKQACEILGVVSHTVRELRRRGILKPIATSGARVRFYTEESVRAAAAARA